MSRRKRDFEDDGRTIADMSGVEGPRLFGARPVKPKDADGQEKKRITEEDGYSKEFRRMYVSIALKATLAIAAVFLVAGALFILFCQHIWLR